MSTMPGIPEFTDEIQFVNWWKQLQDQQRNQIKKDPTVQYWTLRSKLRKRVRNLRPDDTAQLKTQVLSLVDEVRKHYPQHARTLKLLIMVDWLQENPVLETLAKKEGEKKIAETISLIHSESGVIDGKLVEEASGFEPTYMSPQGFLETLSPKAEDIEAMISSRQRYLDQKVLGQGGMGKVVLSNDTMFGRPVARKFSLDPGFADPFMREAVITGYLDHPNIVTVHEIGEENGELYFTMKAIKGEDLEEVIEKQRKRNFSGKDMNEMLQIFVKICDAIAYAHSKNIIHRDLKPANVMVGEFGEVYVTDWGLGKHLEEKDKDDKVNQDALFDEMSKDMYRTMDKGAIKGTPGYLAPEQVPEIDENTGGLKVPGKTDKLSDIYSLGAILYELLTGKNFRHFTKKDNIYTILAEIRKKGFVRFTKPRKANPELPKPLESVVLKAVEPKQKHRYQSVEELRDDVKAFLAEEKVSVHSYSLNEKARRWVSRHQTFSATASAATLLGLLSLAGYSTMSARAERLEREKQQTELQAAKLEKEKAQEEQARLAAEQDKAKIEAEKAKVDTEKAKAETAQKESELKAAQAEAELTQTLRQQLEKAQRRNEAQVFYWQAEELVKRKGDLEKAVELFTKAAQTDPEYGDAYFQRGLANYTLYKAGEAINDFLKANEVSENTAKKVDVRALFYAGMVNLDLVYDSKNAAKLFEKLVEGAENKEADYALLGRSLQAYMKGEFDEALTLAQKAVQKNPTLWEALYIQSGLFSVGLGDAVMDAKFEVNEDEKKALDFLNKALEINPNQTRCLVRRARLHGWLNNEELMQKDLEKLEQILPPASYAKHFFKTHILHDAGKYKEAVDCANEAERKGFTTVDIYRFRGASNYFLKEYEKAEQDLTKAIELCEKSNQNLGFSYEFRGRARAHLGRFEQALEDFNKAISLNPYASLSYNYRGETYLGMNDFEKAKADFEKSIELGNAEGHISLYKFYKQTDDNENAKQSLKDYLKSGAQLNREKVYITLSNVYIQEKDHKSAINLLEEYLKEGHTYKKDEVEKTLKELKKQK